MKNKTKPNKISLEKSQCGTARNYEKQKQPQ